jgi:hypothetical protein
VLDPRGVTLVVFMVALEVAVVVMLAGGSDVGSGCGDD